MMYLSKYQSSFFKAKQVGRESGRYTGRLVLVLITCLLIAFVSCSGLDEWDMTEAIPVTATVNSEQANSIADLLVQTLNNEQLVGLQLSIAPLAGEIWTITAGTQDLDRVFSLDDKHLFRIGSLTKIYTAAMVLQLVDDGLIELDAPVSTYLPSFAQSERFSVRQLLTHQSGVRDIFSILDVFTTSTWHSDKFWSPEELVRACLRRELQFEPGSDTAYSNTNFILLGLIVEHVSGKRPAELYRELVPSVWFPPFESAPSGLVSGFVDNFITMGRWYETRPDNTAWGSAAYTAGALATNSTSIAQFGQRLFGGLLLSPALLEEMTTIKRGKGMGLIEYTRSGFRLVGHEGEITGYTAALLYDADAQLLLAVCSNTTPFDTIDLLVRVRELLE